MKRSRSSATWSCMATLFGLAVGLPMTASAKPKADTKPAAKVDDNDEAEDDEPDEKIRLHFELGGVGYQGNWTQQSFADPAGTTFDVQQHGGTLHGGFFNAVVERRRRTTTFHTEHGRLGFLFGGTSSPDPSGDRTGKPTPRSGFNFGLFSEFRENGGIAFGGTCGAAFSGLAGSSVKASTRSTLPGNHLEVDIGTAAGLHCGPEDMFVLLQYSIEGNLGVEQMQDLGAQQGLDSYDPSEGNGLLFYAGHGPRLLAVRDTKFMHAALSAEYIRSIGDGRWGGKRQAVRATLALTLGKRAFGIAPWYRFDRVDYTEASKVLDPYDRNGHTFGFSFVIARPHDK